MNKPQDKRRRIGAYLRDRLPELSTHVGAVAILAGVGGLSVLLPDLFSDAAKMTGSALLGDYFAAASSAVSLAAGLWGIFAPEKQK